MMVVVAGGPADAGGLRGAETGHRRSARWRYGHSDLAGKSLYCKLEWALLASIGNCIPETFGRSKMLGCIYITRYR